jgi:hypothetical protein
MLPWLATEAVKTLAAVTFGIALVGMSPSWAEKLGRSAKNSGVQWPSDTFVQALLMAHGVAMIVVFILGGYFFFVVLAHYKSLRGQNKSVLDSSSACQLQPVVVKPVPVP